MFRALSARVRAPSVGLAALTVAASAFLAACGGGGGDGGGGGEPAPSESSTTTTTPTTTSVPPVSTPTVRPLLPGAELAPTLAAPQPGSTVLTGDDKQGIYEGRLGIAFVSPAGRLMFKDYFRWVTGWLDMSGSNWSFRTPTVSLSVSGGNLEFVTGSGTFSPKKSMDGKYVVGGRYEETWGPLSYSAANALAVTQNDMAGKWSTTSSDGHGMSFEVDAAGNLTGTTAGDNIGTCGLSGTLVQTEPSTSRNMFNLKIKAANAATGADKACVLDQVEEYDGLAAVLMVPASIFTNEGSYRNLAFHSLSLNAAFLSNNLRKR